MSDVTTTLPAAPRGADTIASNDLASRINAEHSEVRNSLRRGAEHAIKAGQLLLQAKATVGHGNWMEWIATNCQFTHRTAQLYMKVADNRELLEKSNPKCISNLSLTEAIELLEPAKSPNEKPLSGNGTKGKTDRLSEAIKKDPLAILGRAWEVAGDKERRVFMSRIEKEKLSGGPVAYEARPKPPGSP
jgi:hypothetical protein